MKHEISPYGEVARYAPTPPRVVLGFEEVSKKIANRKIFVATLRSGWLANV